MSDKNPCPFCGDESEYFRFLDSCAKRANEIWQENEVNILTNIYKSMDFVQVVRCRDCKHAYPIFDEDGNKERDWLDCHGKLVELWDYYNDDFKDNPVEPDGFCSWGERRD